MRQNDKHLMNSQTVGFPASNALFDVQLGPPKLLGPLKLLGTQEFLGACEFLGSVPRCHVDSHVSSFY